MRTIKYTTEDGVLTNGTIFTIGTRDKYVVSLDTQTLKIFRYSDGRTINEKQTYEVVKQACDDTNVLYIKTNDTILGVWEDTGVAYLFILRPVFRR